MLKHGIGRGRRGMVSGDAGLPVFTDAFDTLDAWTVYSYDGVGSVADPSVASLVGGMLRLTAAAGHTFPYVVTPLDGLTAGGAYRLAFDTVSDGGAGAGWARVGTDPTGANVGAVLNEAFTAASLTRLAFDFAASTATMYLSLFNNTDAVGAYTEYDNVAVAPPRPIVESAAIAARALALVGMLVGTPDATVDRIPVDQAAVVTTGSAVGEREVEGIVRQAAVMTGQILLPVDREPVTRAASALNGQTVAGLDIERITPAAFLAYGNTFTERDGVIVTQAAVTLAGQNVALPVSAELVAVTQATGTLTGRTLTEAERIGVSHRALIAAASTIQTPADTSAVLTYTTPSQTDYGTQNFEFVGRKPQQDYSFRLYSDGRERFELRQGDRETQIFTDETNLDRVQMDGGGNTPDWHPAGWTASGANSGNIDYEIVTTFEWTPEVNVPAGSNWEAFWEWHQYNPQVPGENHAPIALVFDAPSGGQQPCKLNFRNYPSVAAAQAGGPATLVQTVLIPTVVPGTTYTFRERVRFHNTDGIYELWLNGVKVFSRTGVMVGYVNTPHYPQRGCYRATIANKTSVTWFKFPVPGERYTQFALGTGGDPGGGNPGTTYDAIAQAYFDATTATLSTAEKDSINTLVTDLKAAGIPLTGASSCIHLWNVTALDAARRDLLHPTAQASLTGTVTHTPKTGIQGNGTNGVFDTGSAFTTADDTLFLWQTGDGDGNPPMGDADYHNALGRFGGWAQCRISNSSTDIWPSVAPGGGFIAVKRVDASNVQAFDDTGAKPQEALAETAVNAGNTLRYGAVAGQFSASPVMAGGKIAAALTTSQVAALSTALANFRTRQLALA